MIYTTLKQNLQNDVDYLDIMYYVDENWRLVADLFEDSEKYYQDGMDDYTDFDILLQDYTQRQVASACLKHLKERCKGKEPDLMVWEKMFIDLDCDGEIAYDQLTWLIEEGKITNSNQLRDIKDKARKRGCIIGKEYRYGENGIYGGWKNIEDLIDEHFPCHSDFYDDGCNNCCNCCK